MAKTEYFNPSRLRPSTKQPGDLVFEFAVDGGQVRVTDLTYDTKIRVRTRDVSGRGTITRTSMRFDFKSQITGKEPWHPFDRSVRLTPLTK